MIKKSLTYKIAILNFTDLALLSNAKMTWKIEYIHMLYMKQRFNDKIEYIHMLYMKQRFNDTTITFWFSIIYIYLISNSLEDR